MSKVEGKALLFEPGSGNNYSYCNTNYVILTSIIEQVSGLTFKAYIEKNIAEPLGLSATGYAYKSSTIENMAKGYALNMVLEVEGMNLSNVSGAGGIYASATDLLRFFESLEKDKFINDASKVKVPNVEETFYGYGMTYYEDYEDIGEIYFHTGNLPGYSNGVYDLADHDMTIVILSNNTSTDTTKIMEDLYDSIKSSM